jgi:hypothetical protein
VDECLVSGQKTVFFSHLYIKMMILPRQARDKHRENSKKTGFRSENAIFAMPSYTKNDHCTKTGAART